MHFFVDLPFVAQRDLFDFIDYDTRAILRKCSNRTRKLVDSIPIFIDKMHIVVDPVCVKLTKHLSDGSEHEHRFLDKDEILHWGRTTSAPNIDKIEEGIEKLGVILENQNLRIKHLWTNIFCKRKGRLETVREEARILLNLLKMKLISLDRQIWVENAHMCYIDSQDELLSILPFLKPEPLKLIRIASRSEKAQGIEEVLKTEQMKRAEKIVIKRMSSEFPIESIWNFTNLIISFGDYRANDMVRFCDHYSKTQVPLKVIIGGIGFDWLPEDPIRNNIKKLRIHGSKYILTVTHDMDTQRVEFSTQE